MQLDEALGLSRVRAHGLISVLHAIAGGLPGVGWPAVALTAVTAAVVLLGRRLSPRMPLALLAVLAAAGTAAALGLGQASGLPLVSDGARVPSGWPQGAWPSLDPALIHQLLVPASAIVLLGTLELTIPARAGGARPDMRREILAQGWANLVGAFAAGFPASASLTRSALLRLGGAQTRLAAAAAAAFTAPILLRTGRLVEAIPHRARQAPPSRSRRVARALRTAPGSAAARSR